MSQKCRCLAAVVTLFVLSPLLARAQEIPDRLEPMDVFRVQVATDPQISPDGKRIVYARQSKDIASDRSVSNLWIVNSDGSEHRPLTTGNFSDTFPRWSPDGTRLAFLSDRDGKTQLYVRWMDSGQTAKLTDLENPPAGISWSPDGKQIAFTALVSAAPPKIAALPAAPEGAKWAEPPKVYEDLIYRFNGPGYLKPGYTQIFVIASDGGAPRQLTTGKFPHGPGAGGFGGSYASWAPDGKSLVVSMNGTADYEYQPLHTEIFEIRIADGSMTQLTHRNGPNQSPEVSPDGKLIAYTGFDDRYQGHQTNYLYLANRDGTNPHPVTSQLDRDAGSPRWAADGKGIFFTYADQGDSKLAYSSLDGATRVLADHLNAGAEFSVASDGAFAVRYDTPSDPGDVAVASLADPKLRVLTALNRELFTAKKLGAVEEFWYESSFDKRKIEGWIIKPPDFDPSRKYPLIFQIHGGPFSNYGDRFDLNAQIWAARGYVILYTNPRGSTSYGEEFANLIHHAYPGNDFYDLNSGVDALLARHYLDPDNLFVTGGSGGGVLTCWMIDHTDRFRAAASLYPVINWYSWVLTSDLPSFGAQYWFPGNPWDFTDDYMKRSVISLVKNVKTPTLLMTGEEDFRTPISEAEQYYAALKLLKVESVLVRFPGEPHGLSRRPSHQVAKVVYTLNWFDAHRKKP
ncbi:MAG TPA: S9 family peptidase [Candidatus Acidoferrales bacterium]|nr:S9 family peptidase [Candidatus Acidoferrales bacterium]